MIGFVMSQIGLERLTEALQKVVTYYIREYDMTASEIVGALMMQAYATGYSGLENADGSDEIGVGEDGD